MLCVGIMALLYSYCIVTPVKVTKGTFVHPAADVADESLRFYFLERKREEEEEEEEECGGEMEINMENINKLQPLGFSHPPSPLLCICLHLQ